MNYDIFFDSGAFSVYMKGEAVDLQAYINFIKDNGQYFTAYANLDVIGDAEGTYQNQLEMEAAGLKPVPVFHAAEDFLYLERYMEKYDYIAVGGIAGQSAIDVNELDKVWDRICDTPDRMPRCKIHGFGITAVDLLFRYPWYSVDSTTWLVISRFGGVLIPKWRNGQWVYSDYFKVKVSTRSPDQHNQGGDYIGTLSKMEQRLVLKYLHEMGCELGESEFVAVPEDYHLQKNERWLLDENGIKIIGHLIKNDDKLVKYKVIERLIVKGISNDHILRDVVNFAFFKNLEKSLPSWPQPYGEEKVEGFNLTT